MIDVLKPYPAYKDSGVPWLGEIPEHWDVRRVREVANLLVSNVDKYTQEGEETVRLCNYLDVYKNDRITDRLAYMRASATRDEIQRFRLRADDVLITKDSELWNDIAVPALVEYEAADLVCGYHLAILRARKTTLIGNYLFRAVQSIGVASQFHVAANGVTRFGLSHQAIKDIRIPVPSVLEQATIARFLDHADRRIRRYIAAKRKLIALLNEQKQAIINNAVTRGLDPNVRLKPSGAGWLGDVPSHWEVKRLKWVTRLQRGYDLPADQRQEGEVPVISSGGVIGTHSQARATAPGVVMGRYGSTDAVYFVERDYWPHNTALFVTDFNGNDPRWCYYLLRTISKADHASKSAVPGVDRKDLYEIRVPRPSPSEQIVVVRQIESEVAIVETAVDRTQRQIDLMREYRTRLIADVVTGKVDVREVAANLPDEGEEPELEELGEGAAESEEEDLDQEAMLEEVEA